MSKEQEYQNRIIASLNIALGKVLEYFSIESVTDLMVNGDGKLMIDDLKKGRYFSGVTLSMEDRIRVINTVATACNTECNSIYPSLSANLPGSGYRFQGEVPPLCDGPMFVIRKPAILQFQLIDYVHKGELTATQYHILRKAAAERKNVLIVGGTSSGKTTFGNAFLSEICLATPSSRIIIIEDSKELVSAALDTSRLFTDIEHDTSHRLKSCMRLNPARIIVGEIRDGKAGLGLLKALNSGHPGGFTTIHADGSIKGLKKLLQYLEEEIVNPNPRIVSEAIDLVVYMEKTEQGRKVKEIISLSDELDQNDDFIYEVIT